MILSKRLRLLTGSIILLFLSACASTPAAKTDPGQVLAYDCECVDVVTALQGDTLQLYLFRDVYALPRVATASGVKYSDGTTSFWSKGENAVFETADDIYPNCRVDRRRSIWETARLRGVTYRAVGQEPGWHLEVGPETLTAVLDYGARKLSIATPDPDEDKGVTRYQTEQDGQKLEVLLEEKSCQDTMSGEKFVLTVSLTVDGKVYRGCGRRLQE